MWSAMWVSNWWTGLPRGTWELFSISEINIVRSMALCWSAFPSCNLCHTYTGTQKNCKKGPQRPHIKLCCWKEDLKIAFKENTDPKDRLQNDQLHRWRFGQLFAKSGDLLMPSWVLLSTEIGIINFCWFMVFILIF